MRGKLTRLFLLLLIVGMPLWAFHEPWHRPDYKPSGYELLQAEQNQQKYTDNELPKPPEPKNMGEEWENLPLRGEDTGLYKH